MSVVAESENSHFVVLQHPPIWGLPSSDETCISLQAYLRLAAVQYRVENCPNQPDSARLPALEDGLEVVYANEGGGPIAFLREHRDVDLDAALTEEERAEALALTALVQKHLGEAAMYQLWLEPENADVAQEAYAQELPWPLSRVLAAQKQHSVLQYFRSQGLEGRGAEIYDRATAAYGVLARRLDAKLQFFDERPSRLDAVLLAHLALQLHGPLKKAVLKAAIEQHPGLVRFVKTWQSRLFGEQPPGDPPPFSRTQGRRQTRSSQPPAASGESKDDKTKAMHRRARYFLLAQAASLVVYVLCSSLSFEIEEDEGDDDDGDGDE